MQTYSHFLLTAVLGDRLKKKETTFSNRALLVGSFMPDVPLLLLTIGYAITRQINPDISDTFILLYPHRVGGSPRVCASASDC